MEFSHVLHKEIPLDKDHIFSANVTENNGVEQVSLKNLNYTQPMGYRLTNTLNLMFLYKTSKEKKLSAIF